jgi:hypothetical protein
LFPRSTYILPPMYDKVGYYPISLIPISEELSGQTTESNCPSWELSNPQFRVSTYAPPVHGWAPAPTWRESRGQNWDQEFLLHSSMVSS